MPTASYTLSPSALFRKAWAIARAGARRFGGRPRSYLSAALKQAWAEAKSLAATVAAQRARVLAELAKIRAEFSPLGVARRRRAEAALEVEFASRRDARPDARLPATVGQRLRPCGEGRVMAAVNMAYTTAPASVPAGYLPDEDDLAQMAQVHAIHDVLDLCPALPLDARLALLDHAWLLLGGNGQPASEPRRVA